MKTPNFWQKQGFMSCLLNPLSKIYTFLGEFRRKKTIPYKSKVPVICVGNLTSGGSGKTPVAIAIAIMLAKGGLRPFFLTRGYKGKLKNIKVNTTAHDAKDVGDEAVLLSRVAPTVVNPNRANGAKFAEDSGAEIIIMDDGFQNPQLYKDISIVVIDGSYGFGNGKVIPSGCLREPIVAGLKRADFAIIIGEDEKKSAEICKENNLPVFYAKIEPDADAKKILNGRNVIAFAGTGIPQKFFKTVLSCGCKMVGHIPFPDHHNYKEKELAKIIEIATSNDAIAITTEKDYVKIPLAFCNAIMPLPISLVFEDETKIADLLAKVVK